MGSKGRLPPPHVRRPLPGPGMLHPDPFGPGIRPPPGGYPFDMLPHPPEIMEQKLATQHVEMERLLTENQRLAATHGVLRRELAAAQHELQRLQDHVGAMKAEQEQHLRGLLDKISKMEADLQASEPVKQELQQAHTEAQSLVTGRQELISKVQQLTQDLQRSHGDVQQIPSLMSELDGLRQEYQHCRATYDYERKLRIDHYESLQVMEKNYISMVREVEKLRAELMNTTNVDKSGGSYSITAGYKENDSSAQRSVGQNAYEDAYGVPQGRGAMGGGAVPYGEPPAANAPSRPGYDAPTRGPSYDAPRNSTYEASKVPAGYGSSRGGSYETPKGAGGGYEVPRGPGYDATASRGAGGAQTATAAGNIAGPYGSAQTPPPYGSAQGLNPYGSTQAPNQYGSTQAPNQYGSAQPPNSYGSAQAPSPYGAAQAPNPYGSAQAPNPYGSAQAPAGSYDAQPRSGGNAGGGNTGRT
ncbi:protein FLX-like 2 [Iris pallida]|uniref:Protein FLX-like 2 n=1 Tax=Iris pallida TaxID=29817 RepID=A0AAX6GMD8_IRIPA|nr:protein FLX-like 2 [Iris pallida]KAJ6829411.1 protein FLX-like 2 [Iris pallida]